MARLQCDFFSKVLGKATSLQVIIPTTVYARQTYPTLYLLHGYSDDQTAWTRQTSIERYVEELGLAVIMPDAGKSFYTDMAYGDPYWKFVSEEVPNMAQRLFPLSEKREDNFVAGLSMGGYGAFKMALRCPGKFAAAASLSGAVDIAHVGEDNSTDDGQGPKWSNVFGDLSELAGSDNDLFQLVKRLETSSQPKPKLYQCCGTEDFLYADNVKFRELMQGKDYDYKYVEGPGAHTWAYWDAMIQDVLRWLPIRS